MLACISVNRISELVCISVKMNQFVCMRVSMYICENESVSVYAC